ncbi:hypothetical protein GGR58DRAFT_487501 [Xylaria digitata]|nr:hypothetical protein GGR58DRAFT_487501 [Xylaria digitata]
MDESLKRYLGTKKSAALEKYLDDLTAKPGAQPFMGFGVWPRDDNYRLKEIDAVGNNDSLWTHVVISVKGIFSKRMAEHTLRNIDKELDVKLSPEQQPPRVSYCLDDDSKTQYRAKSYRIRGTLPPRSGNLERRASEDSGSLDITPPGSPRGGYIVKTNFVEVELGFEDEPLLVTMPPVAL